MSRTFSTSRIQREVIQAHGQSGSNQKSAGVLPFAGVFWDISLLGYRRLFILWAATPPEASHSRTGHYGLTGYRPPGTRARINGFEHDT
ncbi:hypothetical protein SCYAM73S_01093 [Streptomyces cyaneofuscatus]